MLGHLDSRALCMSIIQHTKEAIMPHLKRWPSRAAITRAQFAHDVQIRRRCTTSRVGLAKAVNSSQARGTSTPSQQAKTHCLAVLADKQTSTPNQQVPRHCIAVLGGTRGGRSLARVLASTPRTGKSLEPPPPG